MYSVYLSWAFAYKTYNAVFISEVFHPQSNTDFKASLTLMHMTTSILRSSNLNDRKRDPISVGDSIFSIGETFHTHLCSILENRK